MDNKNTTGTPVGSEQPQAQPLEPTLPLASSGPEATIPPAMPGSLPEDNTVQSQDVAQSQTTNRDTPEVSRPAPEPVKPKREGGILSLVTTLVIAFVLVQIINMFFFQSYKVFGNSMYSTLTDGDRLIISKIGKTTAKVTGKKYTPTRGEIVVFVDPLNPNIQLIKRVIGLPGERVVVRDGKITVYNDENPKGFNPDDAEYKDGLPDYTTGEKDVVVPKDHIFVSGDNRTGSNSLDSRNELGTVPEEEIVGSLKVRIFPLDSARFF